MPKVRLEPQGIEIEAPKKCNLLQLLHASGVAVGSACGGKGICASCKVTVLKGLENLSRPKDLEIDLSSRNNLQRDERISCQCKVLGDIVLTTSYW